MTKDIPILIIQPSILNIHQTLTQNDVFIMIKLHPAICSKNQFIETDVRV